MLRNILLANSITDLDGAPRKNSVLVPVNGQIVPYRFVNGEWEADTGMVTDDHDHDDLYYTKQQIDSLPSGGNPEWDDVQGKPAEFPPAPHVHDYAATDHDHSGVYAPVHNHPYEPANANIQAHVTGAHAPFNAQKNSDITKAEIEAVLTGVVASHSHAGGSDPWTYVKLNADFTTSSASAVDAGLGFTPQANQTYIWESCVGIRTATATVNPRLGFAWATGMTDGVCTIEQTSTATAKVMANGNPSAAILIAVGGVPNNSQSWIGSCWGFARAGTPSGQCRLQLASETAGTVVRIVTGSYLRFRPI